MVFSPLRCRPPLLRPALLATLLFAVPGALPARAADVMEPWGEGLSNVELFATFGSGLDGAETSAALGTGLPGGFSLGLTLASPEEGATEAGLLLVWSRSLGRFGELDLWGEYLPVGSEVELLGAQRLVGAEWSGESRLGVPYARLSWSDDGEARHLHPLLGWMVPLGDRLELHLELSSEEPADGSWPIHLAVGPNWALTPAVEILPELSMVWDPEGGSGGEASFFFTVGICVDPTTVASGSGE